MQVYLIWLKGQLRPVMMEVFDEELASMLAEPLPVERIDQWIAVVEKLGIGRIKKAFVLRTLKKKRKQAVRGERVTLTARERDVLREKAAKHLPPIIVRKWLACLLVHAEKHGMTLRLSSFDDSMVPAGMPPMDLDPRMEAFGFTNARIRRVLLLMRRKWKVRALPEMARAWLKHQGVSFEP